MEIILGSNLSLAGLNRSFTKADDLDLGVGRIRLSGNNSAGYCTSIPISDADYRKQNPTRARAAHELKDGWYHFSVWDDWGTRHEIKISDDQDGRQLALAQIASLESNGLLSASSTQVETVGVGVTV